MHALGQLAGYVCDNYGTDNITVVSPDSGRVRVAEKWADALNGAPPLAFIHKTRDPLVPPNQVKSNRVVGEVEGRTCVLIDDMIDTGGTIAGGRSASSRTPVQATSSSPPPTASSPIPLPSAWPDAAPRRSSRPTRCPSRTTSASRTSPSCRSPRCSHRRSARSSKTVRSQASSTASPSLFSPSQRRARMFSRTSGAAFSSVSGGR